MYALKKNNYISISLETPKQKTSPKESVVTPIKEESSKVESKNINIDDLFSDVWTKKITKKKKPKKKIDNRRLQEIQKKSKLVKKQNSKKVIKTSSNSSAKKSEQSHKESTAPEVNEYLAKIQALVYENFEPPQNSQGYSVKAVIELSSIGKVMSFRILNYSTSSSLNSECDKIKDRLAGVLFPPSPNNSSGKYIIILTSKE